jgi:RNA polymerase sigma-B factor
MEQAADMEAVRQHWNQLPGAQRKILLMRFYGNMSQSQIAARLDCSQMQVSRLQTRALAFLRGACKPNSRQTRPIAWSGKALHAP